MIRGVKGNSGGVHVTGDELAEFARFLGLAKGMHFATSHPVVVRLYEAAKFANESVTEVKEF